MQLPVRRSSALVIAVLIAAACGASDRTAGSAATPLPVRSSAAPCPTAATSEKWPTWVPAELPVPPGLHILETRRTSTLDQVKFRTTLSVRDAARFLATQLPANGFALRGGDSEEDEVDQPFTGHGRRGTLKLQRTAPCTLTGVLNLSGAA